MKDKIHPQYQAQALIHCACGNEIKVGSTKGEMMVEVCSNCHPFYTGKQKLVDAAGRIDRFKKRLVEAEKVEKKEEQRQTKKTKSKAQLKKKTAANSPKKTKEVHLS